MFAYKWAETDRALENVAKADASPFDDVVLEYVNPQTGGPVMHTFTCHIQRLRPGIHTRAHRHVSSSVYFCFEGEGSTIIDGVEFRWSAGDSFVIPSWAIHEHRNASRRDRALLFSLHDSPLMKAVRKYREASFDDNDGHQVVHGRFE